MPDNSYSTPEEALKSLRERIQQVAGEYAEGKINSAQYNALYRYYSEKRALLEHICRTDANSSTWRTVAASDDTPFLREQFAARLLYCAVFRKGDTAPLLTIGRIPRKVAESLYRTLRTIWDGNQWRYGVARRSLGDGIWLVLCLGRLAMTAAVFYLPPSGQQFHLIREAHQDFEQANASLLSRNVSSDRMVFPQRALFDDRS